MKIRGGMLLARALQEKGVEQVFTLSGGFCNPALEGFMACGISVINSPHEQVAGHLADGFTRITRKPTVCLVGPEGFANAVPAMMEAFGERTPVIFITGSSTFKRSGAGGFKEINDVAIAAPLTKYSESVTDGERIPEFVDRAYKIAISGYPGPVHLSVPVDIMFSSFDEDAGRQERPFYRGPVRAARAWPCPEDLDAVIDVIANAKRPILIGGHGIWWSRSEKSFQRAGEALSIPLFNVPYHRKLLGDEVPCMMGLADVHQFGPATEALQEADVCVMVGGRLDNQMNFGNPPFFPESTRLICVNGSPEELEMNRSADMTLLSDPSAFLDALSALAGTSRWQLEPEWLNINRRRRNDWVDKTKADLAQAESRPGISIHPLRLAIEVQQSLGENDWLVFDGGNTHFWSEIAVSVTGNQGRTLRGVLHPGTFSMLGVGVSLGLAAKLAHPDDHVVLISGDGAFLSGGLSIEAAFQENAPITVVIDNNGGLDCISQQQERMFENGQHFATDFRDIPFHTLFEGMGGYGELVTDAREIGAALARARASGKTACLNVKTTGVISPIVAATSDKRDKASIE